MYEHVQHEPTIPWKWRCTAKATTCMWWCGGSKAYYGVFIVQVSPEHVHGMIGVANRDNWALVKQQSRWCLHDSDAAVHAAILSKSDEKERNMQQQS
jgi:hypothetical protein